MFYFYTQILWKQYLLYQQCTGPSEYVAFVIEKFNLFDCLAVHDDISCLDIPYSEIVGTRHHSIIPKKIGNAIFKHLEKYLNSQPINLSLEQLDYILHGISSLVLTWNLIQYRSVYCPTLSRFLIAMEGALRNNELSIFQHENMFLYTPCSLKIWKSVVTQSKISPASYRVPDSGKYFDYFTTNYKAIVSHLKLDEYYDFLNAQLFLDDPAVKLKNVTKWNDFCENIDHFTIPQLQLHQPQQSTIKYVTGTACVGKSSILKKLKNDYNWQIFSRGQLGTFAGKAKTSLHVAGLHFALDYVLGKRNVIGDRGTIDNPLWTIIMDVIKLTQQNPTKRLREKLFYRFFELFDCFNEPALLELSQQNVFILIDNCVSENKKRMRNRGTGNDLHRSSIKSYVLIQNLAYYVCAKLFPRWKLLCVPYTLVGDQFEIDSHLYTNQYVEKMNQYFSMTRDKGAKAHCASDGYVSESEDDLPMTISFSKINPNLHPSHQYSQHIGIYK